ncbi:phage baseplate assembly protein V [Nocardia sp. XZ_19_385]|uniref:phage baseplate assembly protein V n=1 Tax=Nocardia sp. XZ_19_385 TaxID=2769488 RepID=UPI00188EB1C2|nr:phage baseplate assembly protein V [Nocardia sp. XZ_19_385]
MTEAFYAPRFDIRISGLTVAADVTNQTLSLTVETNLDLAGTFHLTLANPDNVLLDSALFDLGKTVEIHLGYGNKLEPAFLGEITAIEPSFPTDGPPVVRVIGYDKSYKMRRNQPEPTEYKYVNDSIVAARIAVENGLIPLVDPTPGFHKQLLQSESDMAFLKSRAERYFFDVYVEWDRLHFQFPRPQTAAHVLEWGKNLSSFAPKISTAGLAGLQVIRSYNQELAQTLLGIALAADFDLTNLEERLGSSAMDMVASLVRKGIRTGKIGNPLDAMAVARSMLANLLEGMYEGTGTCIGIPDLKAGNYIDVQGVGKRFGGTYRVRKVTHRVDDSGFHTDFEITQRSHTSLMGLLRKQISEEPSPNKPEQFFGVWVATVVDNKELLDVPPELPLGRVKLEYPGLSTKITSGWAPCARPMGGKNMGFYAQPEPGEQVLIAFEKGDLASPYVLGSLSNALSMPPVTNVDGQNSKRVIKSRAGHTITFDDTLDVGKVVIEDKLGSSVTLDSTDGSISINAMANLSITANGPITLKAPSINIT